MTFNREVLSGLLYPKLIETDVLSVDARERVARLMSEFSTPIGAYASNSKGHLVVRKSVADYIKKRDGNQFEVDPNNIFLTNGASEGVKLAFKMLIR
jgi:alanine transaminase